MGDTMLQALDKMIQMVEKSDTDADIVFRSVNWAWPPLTARARATSAEGIQIVQKFVRIFTLLLAKCSDPLLNGISRCKLPLRAIARALGAINPEISCLYLKAVNNRIFGDSKKAVNEIRRGFILDKAAMDQFIALLDSSEDDELVTVTESIVEQTLRHALIYDETTKIEYLVRIVKVLRASSDAARIVSSVLEANHHSSRFYNSLMEKFTFLSSGSTTSQKLRTLNFYIDIIGSECAGSHIPYAITKSELTSNIINHKANNLVAIFSLRLLRVILERIGRNTSSSEDAISKSMMRDKLVDLNSIIPVFKFFLSSSHPIFISEICRVIVAYKTAFPGPFVELKFNWSKLISTGSEGKTSRVLVARMVMDLVKTAVPITPLVAENIRNAMDAVGDYEEILEDFVCANPVFASCASAVEWKIWFKHAKRNEYGIRKFFDVIVNTLIKGDVEMGDGQSVLMTIALKQEDEDLHALARKVEKKIRKSSIEEDAVNDMIPEESEIIVPASSHAIPSSMKRRHSIQPLDDDAVDYYQPNMSDAATVILSNEFDSGQPVINLIELFGIKVGYFYSTIMGLSSGNLLVRTCAYETLSVVLRALAMSIEAKAYGRFSFREAPQVAMVLTWLRNGIDAPSDTMTNVPNPLSRIICAFIVEAIKIMFDQKHDLYQIVYRYILDKPSISLVRIPMFSQLFFSTSGEICRVSRAWILDVLVAASIGGEFSEIDSDMLTSMGICDRLMEGSIHMNATEEEFEKNLRIFSSLPNSSMAFVMWLTIVSRHSRFLRSV